MIKEEERLHLEFGKQQPFRVPEGYFDTFTEQMMARIPQQEAQIVEIRQPRHRLRPFLLAAASVCVAIFTVGIYLHDTHNGGQETATIAGVQSSSSAYSAIDQAADYTMMDNEDMYAYVSGY